MVTLLSLVLVSAYYSGETINLENDLGTENLIYTIIDNSSELIVLPNITINSTNIQINFPANMPPNDFTIVFLEEQTKEVVREVYVGGGGGGGSTKYVDRNITKYVPVEVEVIKYVNQTDEGVVEEDSPIWKDILFMIVFVLGGSFLLTIITEWIRNRKKQEEQDE